mmetsp:Transcript_82325/g.136191  ORF Transcript_82325/g.136191 Transcript_82325/m.136191 type:complete len:289 (-) Transcript_82325:60-926(-)
MMHRVWSCLRTASKATGKSSPSNGSGAEVLQSTCVQESHLPPNREALGQVETTAVCLQAEAPLQSVPAPLGPALGSTESKASRIYLHWAPNATCYVVDGALSPNEADVLRDWVENSGTWEPAMIASKEGYVVDESHRHHVRMMLDEPRLAYDLWMRICKFFPRNLMGSTVCCLNERLRFLKYGPGNFFAPHADMTFSRSDPPQHSCLTLILYLSDSKDCCGGTTRFISPSCVNAKQGLRCDHSCVACVDADVKKGSILVFEHQLEHAGTLLTSGEKFVMRTDVMFGAD